jgi:hypothetical protein
MHMKPHTQAVLRCAVYTRKSSEEGLHRVLGQRINFY